MLAARHKPRQSDGRAWLEEFPVATACRVAEPFELEPLTPEAVGEAVVQLGHPLDDLPGREGVLDALYTLTDRGDPLLVGLWAGQLWKARGEAESLDANGLARLQPGYGGFVEVWEERQAVPRAYLEWGSATVAVLNSGKLSPDQCPGYLLRHYSAHVLTAGLSSDQALDQYLLPLLSEGWMRAWEEEREFLGNDGWSVLWSQKQAVDGGYEVDIRRVQETLRKSNDIRHRPSYRIGGEIRCALIRSGIRWLRRCSWLWGGLIFLLADSSVQKIHSVIRAANEIDYKKGDANLLISAVARQQPLIARAVRAGRSRAQSALLRETVKEVLRFAGGIGDANHRSNALLALAGQLVGEERGAILGEVLEIERGSLSDDERAKTPAAVTKLLAGDPTLLHGVWASDGHIDGERSRIAVAVAEQLREDKGRALLDDALTVAPEIAAECLRTEAAVASTGQFAPGSVAAPGESLNATMICEYGVLAATIDEGSYLPPGQFLDILKRLAPAIAALGGATAVRETADAIRDVGRWWP